jgi:hypothetical protein
MCETAQKFEISVYKTNLYLHFALCFCNNSKNILVNICYSHVLACRGLEFKEYG